MRGIDTYNDTVNDAELNEFVQSHRLLVVKIAKFYKRRLPSHIDFEDLLQSGFIGLIEAKQLFKSNMGASFETFATIKIRGSIIDSLRKYSFGSRETIRNMKRVSEAIRRIEQRDHHEASSKEIALELGVSDEEYAKISQNINISHIANIDYVNEHASTDENENPDNLAEKEDVKKKVMKYLLQMPKKEQLVLSLYYIEELTFKQVAEVLELTEARICQLHCQAIERLRTKLNLPKKEKVREV